MKRVDSTKYVANFLLKTILTLLLFRCTETVVDPGTTSTVDNKVVQGVIYDTYGKPADSALVVIRPSDYIPQGYQLSKCKVDGTPFICSTYTDSSGTFEFTAADSIPAGNYSIEARDDIGNCVLIQDIRIDSLLLTSDTGLDLSSPEYETKLKKPSTVKGTVPPFGDSVPGIVFVYGLDIYATIDRNGNFMLENVPEGDLQLEIVADEKGTEQKETISVTTRSSDIVTVSVQPKIPTIEVDANNIYQTIDGFGASSAWINLKINTDLATIFWKNDTLDGHIGLSLLRTHINPREGYDYSEASPMLKAIEANPNIRIWSTSWTPPAQFKDTNSLSGGHFNTDSVSMQGFADFLVKYVQDVKINTGIDLYAVSCQNEPDKVTPEVEGCLWTGEQFRVFLKNYWGPACDKAGITTKRIIGESVKNDLTLTDLALKDTNSAKYTDIIGTHIYKGGPNPYPLADSLYKPYWMTEICRYKGDVDTSISDALTWANQIHDCMVRCNMSAYHYWWLVNYNDDTDEGLCTSERQPTPRMYALGNFSKFIRPGFVRVAATESPAAGVNISAYYGPLRMVVVAINNGDETTCTITIPGIPEGKTAVPWITDRDHRLERQQPVALSDKAFLYTLPSQSVVTFVLKM